MTADVQSPKRSILTVKQFCDRNPAFTAGGIRHLIFRAEYNGFSRCFRRVGRRVYIDEDLFYQCVDKQ